jgi:hypothetical protein
MYNLQGKPDTHDDRAAAQARQVSSDAASRGDVEALPHLRGTCTGTLARVHAGQLRQGNAARVVR